MLRNMYRIGLQTLALGVVGLAFGLTDARAAFSVQLDSTAAAGNDNTTFNYSASISSNESIVAGDYFKIVDFSGLVGTPTAPAGWTATTQLFDPTLPNVVLSHGDDPGVPNLVFTYTGSTPIVGSTAITGFSAVSVFPTAGSTKDFYGVTTTSSGLSVSSVSNVLVPTYGIPYPSPVPEPSSVISGGIGVVVFGLAFARRRFKACSAC